MVQTVTIPLAWSNNIPGVAGIEDVTFEVPEVSDIADAVVDNTLQATLVDELIRDALSDFEDDIAEAIDIPELDIDVPGEDVIADAVLDRLDVQPGLFGPLDRPLDVFIQDAINQAVSDLTLPDIDTEGLQEDIEQLVTAVEDVDVPSTDAIAQAVRTEIEDVITDALPTDFLDDPIQWLEDNLLDATPDVNSELEERLQALEVEDNE